MHKTSKSICAELQSLRDDLVSLKQALDEVSLGHAHSLLLKDKARVERAITTLETQTWVPSDTYNGVIKRLQTMSTLPLTLIYEIINGPANDEGLESPSEEYKNGI